MEKNQHTKYIIHIQIEILITRQKIQKSKYILQEKDNNNSNRKNWESMKYKRNVQLLQSYIISLQSGNTITNSGEVIHMYITQMSYPVKVGA